MGQVQKGRWYNTWDRCKGTAHGTGNGITHGTGTQGWPRCSSLGAILLLTIEALHTMTEPGGHKKEERTTLGATFDHG